ncbi:hypothetical protein ADN00_05025 [Ornatilinea apprima]|uniref:DUF4352 domain-containing protein n=1 Tax=Ornatilinea apprima TaxID=1134406 RepID=A0A0P6XGE2_9CHLR|nr:hypothetical protein [Ornatilinea apprima]KPL79208.1 hypothetical protein ADN00_05025 [Ornatilinea apprima]
MNHVTKPWPIIFTICLALLFTACAAPAQAQPLSQPALVIRSSTTALGAEGDQQQIGVLSYTFVLENTSQQDILLLAFTPQLNPAYAARLLGKLQAVPVGLGLSGGETVELGGQLRFDFSGLSKQDIEALGHPLAGWLIQSESFIPQPGSQP